MLTAPKTLKLLIFGMNFPSKKKSWGSIEKLEYIDAYKSWKFRKNCANEWPLRGKVMAKIRNFDSFGAMFPHFCPDKREIWHGIALPRAIFDVYRGTCRPCGAKKPLLDHCVKTIPAWQYRHGWASRRPAGKNITLFRLQPARDPRSPPYLARW